MALYKLEDIYPDYRDRLRDIGDIKGMSVYAGETNDKIGYVYDALVDETGHFRYLVIDTGSWIPGKRVLLPIGCCRFDRQHVLATGLRSREQVQQLPGYDDNVVVDQRYEEQVRSIYRTPTRAVTTQTVSQAVPQAVSQTVTQTVVPTDVPIAEPPVESSVAVESSLPVEEVVAYETARVVQQPVDSHSTTTASVPYAQEPPLYETTPDQHRLVKLYEERLVVNKAWYKTGEVVISKRVETDRDRVSVPLEKTRIIIEISPVQHQVIRTDETQVYQQPEYVQQPEQVQANYNQDTEIARFNLYEETIETRKQPVVRQEIVIRKEIVRDVVDIEDTIRREELDIAREGDPKVDVLDRP
ncbi:MAG: hypothetical protein Kow00121_21420 [Elainellaceae cyanobacterium]